MLEEHLFDTSLEAVKASLAIDCSMQRQQQSLMDQALFGSVKPLASDSSLSALANNGQDIGTMHKNQDHTIETHKKSFARLEANHDRKGKSQ